MKASHASNAGWNSFCPSIPVAHTDEDMTTPTLTSFPDYHSLSSKGGISDSSILSNPDDLGVYVIRACNSIAPPCSIPGDGPGGLAPSSYLTLGTGMDGFFLCRLLHGRPQWVCRVGRSSASYKGPASLVTASALEPPRLHDPTGRHASPRRTPSPNPQLDYSPRTAPPVRQTTASDNGDSIAAEHLSNTLLSYSHRDWEQAQHVDPYRLCLRT